jgi:aminoglycoside phosphotransferase (APT) family kinase protein
VTSINSYQRHLDDAELADVLAASGISPGLLAERVELGEASYNTAYRLRLTDGSGLVLKIAPDPSMPGLSYERDLMRTETLFYRTAVSLPVPQVVHADFSRELIDSDFLLMTELPGANWYGLRSSLADSDRDRLRRDLGNILLHEGRITGIVDGERAFWGDPLAEMVSLALFASIEDDPAFLDGYGGIDFTDSARRRLALYRTYLYLIMLVEGAPRGYSGPDREALVKITSLHLRKALTELQT